MATKVEKSVDVSVPVETAYNQWTQFEEFPHFMDGISEIRQLDDTTLHWVAEIGGIKREWKAKILEQVPNKKVAWAATEGATNAGAVHFSSTGADSTAVRLELEYEPEGLVESAADKVGLIGKRAEADLKKFKSFIEDEGYATGAWRGNVAGNAGTPGVEDAQSSKGDDGKAGISAKQVVAGVAGLATAAGLAAAAKSKSGDSDDDKAPAPVATRPPVKGANAPTKPRGDDAPRTGDNITVDAPVGADSASSAGTGTLPRTPDVSNPDRDRH